MIDGALDKIALSIDKLRSKISETPPLEILELIQELWIPYTPSNSGDEKCVSGIDSGYNYDEAGGYILFIANAGSLNSCRGLVYSDVFADIYFPYHEPEKDLTGISIKMEIDAIENSLKHSSYILVDGSLVSKLSFLVKYSASKEEKYIDPDECISNLLKVISEADGKIIFIAKSSSSRELFKRYIDKGDMFIKPDLFYFEKYTREPGYSKPESYIDQYGAGVIPHIIHVRNRYGYRDLNIYFSYIRLEPNTPIYRIEVPILGELRDREAFFREILDTIYQTSIGGYPIVLREIDRLVRVSRDDIDKLKLMLGLERTSRTIEPPKGV